MDKNTAQRLVRDSFKAAFDKKRYRDFINELCNGFDEGKAQNMEVPDAFTPHVKSCQRLGTFKSIEATNNAVQRLRTFANTVPPLFAPHLQRYAFSRGARK